MFGWRQLRKAASVLLLVGLMAAATVALEGCGSSRCSMFGDDPWPLCGI